ncbi:WD40 repeat domain-containing protein [Thiohalobacter thiocyanaticus]|nr:WD40 repeat domain-containing protein [Thiohalobacter thiocyanaticus]
MFSLKPAIPANVMHEGVHSGGSALAFNPAGTLLASGGWEGRVYLWSLPGGKRQAVWQAHDGSVNGLAFIEDGGVLISAGYDRRIVLWDLRGDGRASVRTESPVTSLAVAAGRGLLASGHDDGRVIVWRLQDKRRLERVGQKRLHTRRVRGLAWHPGKPALASSGRDGRVMQWTIGGGVVEFPPPSTYSRSLVYTPNGRTLIGSGWFRLFRWDLEARRLHEIPTEHNGIINSIALGSEGRHLASISRQTDSAVYFLDPSTGEVIERFQPHELCGGFVALSGDGRYLATTSDDASVRIWDLERPRGKRTR